MRSDRDDGLLRDMLRQITLAHGFLGGSEYREFEKDMLRLYAVTCCLEIISEASRRLSDALKARHPEIPWKEMAGAGNIYRHNYEDLTARRIWDTAKFSLPVLRAAIEKELGGTA